MTDRSAARRWSGSPPRPAVLAGLLVGWCLAPGAAQAQRRAAEARPVDATARAREAFQEGVKLEASGAYAEALVRFREVAAVKKTPQVLFHIAQCLEKTGVWSDALATYRQAAQLAGPGNSEVKLTIDQALASLEQRTPTLTLTRGKGARNAVVLLDGRSLDDLREPLRLPPGKHVVQARARNKDNFRAEVTLAEGQRATVTVVLDDLEGEPSGEPDRGPGDSPADPGSASKRPVGPYILMGVGVGALALGGAFYGLRSGKKSELEGQCAGLTCPTSARSTGDSLRRYNTLSNVAVGVGLAGLGAGVIWWLAAPATPSPPAASSARLRLAPQASPTPLGVGLAGDW